MARITVEDCLKKIPNRFQMVLTAAYPSDFAGLRPEGGLQGQARRDRSARSGAG